MASVDLLHPQELDESDLARWTAFLGAGAETLSPFLLPQFTQYAARHAPNPQVAVFRQDGEIRGYLPFQWRNGFAQPLGAPLNDYQALIAAPDFKINLAEMPALLGARAVWVTGWWGETGERALGEAAQGSIADVSGGADAYFDWMRTAHKKFGKNLERSQRNIEKDLGEIGVDIVSRDPAHFDALIDLKRKQYARTGQHDIFACGWTVDLLRDLMQADGADGFGGVNAVMSAGGKPMAYEFSLRGGVVRHFWIPAYEAWAARYSPGMLLSLETIRQGAMAGERLFDLGAGGEAYKRYFANESASVFSGFAWGRRALRGRSSLMGAETALKFQRRLAVITACEVQPEARYIALARSAMAALSLRSNAFIPKTKPAWLL